MENDMTMAIVRAGMMGRGIAQIFSTGGYRTLLYDIEGRNLESSMAWIKDNMEEYVRREILTGDEARELLRQWAENPAARHCPHGRPTAVVLSRADLEKLFKRRV